MKFNNKFIDTTTMSHDEWLNQRTKGIGGSDASTIVGMNKYASIYSLWADKMGLLPPIEDNEAMRIGRDLEDYVAKRFSEATGKKVRKKNAIIIHNEYDFIFANIDREIIGEQAGLECKTTSVLNLKKFKNGEFPENYYAQCVHYMAVTGAEKWYLAVLIMGNDFKIFEIERDEEEITALINAEKEFWERYVVGETMPGVDSSKATTNAVNAICSLDIEEDIAIEIDEIEILDKLYDLELKKKELEKAIDVRKNLIKIAMDKSTIAICNNYKVTWKFQERTSYDTKKMMLEHSDIDFDVYKKTSKYRVFSMKKTAE